MTEARHDRRRNDIPGERLVALETGFEHLSKQVDKTNEILSAHGADETHLFKEHSLAVQRLASSQEQLHISFAKIAESLAVVTSHATQLTLLEEFRARTEKHRDMCDRSLSELHEKYRANTESVNRLYWFAGIMSVLLSGFWQMIVHFKII